MHEGRHTCKSLLSLNKGMFQNRFLKGQIKKNSGCNRVLCLSILIVKQYQIYFTAGKYFMNSFMFIIHYVSPLLPVSIYGLFKRATNS